MRNVVPSFVRYGMLILVGLSCLETKVSAQDKFKGNAYLSFQVIVSVNGSTPTEVAVNQSNPKIDLALKVRRGDQVKVVVNGKPNTGFYTYPVTLKQTSNDLFDLSPIKGRVDLLGETQESPAPNTLEIKAEQRIHKGAFTWTQMLLINPKGDPGPFAMPIKLHGQVCKGACWFFEFGGDIKFEVSSQEALTVSPDVVKEIRNPSAVEVVGLDFPPSGADKKHENKEIIFGLINSSQSDYLAQMAKFSDKVINDKITNDNTAADLWAFILGGIFWGAISLVTPCVFPMIPITVSIFLKQSEKEHHRPILMASVYSGTIVVVLTLAAAFMLEAFRILSVNPIMNYGLGALFVFFSLSLFGMYEIELPSGLARFTSAHESKGGVVGTMFMALTFTIISFACVAPFLGGFGGTAAGVSRPLWVNLLGGLAFSATFAAPFFFLALFPTLLRKMPKSGSWLNSVKVVMGFLELAAAIKFCRSAELVITTEPWLITFDFAMGAYVALSLFAGLYLLGLFRLPHDSPEEHLSVPRMIFAGIFIALAVYLAPSLMKNPDGDNIRPRGAIYSWVESFLLPDAVDSPNDEPHTPSLAFAVEKSMDQYRKSMDQYQKDQDKLKDESEKSKKKPPQPQRIFVDFTGVTCTNCKINEKSVFTKRYVRQLMDQYLIVKLYCDVVPAQYYSETERANAGARQKKDAAANLEFERKVFNNEQLPLYAILEPQADGTVKVLAVYDEGRINNETAFADFLRKPK